eukprot:g4843.t1
MFAEEVLQRIEAFVVETVEVVAAGQLPVFAFSSRQPSETLVPFAISSASSRVEISTLTESKKLRFLLLFISCLGGDDNFQNDWGELMTPPDESIELPSWEWLYKKDSNHKVINKDLISRNGVHGFSITRVFRILNCVHELLTESKKCTQRELYYRLIDPPVFCSLNDVTEAVSDVCCLLQVPRSSLNICCASKGAVAGIVQIKDVHSDSWKDCTRVGSMGYPIPGDAIEVQQMQIISTAQFVLIIEKDAVFQRQEQLTEDRFFDFVPCVLVTGRGMPDLCTRIFLNELTSSVPELTVLALVDWNPSGIAILATYKHGSVRMGPHANQYLLPCLKWLGIRAWMLDGVPRAAFQSLTTRDRAMIQTLNSMLSHNSTWLEELRSMEHAGVKCDIEALYSVTNLNGLTHRLVQWIVTGQYIS